MIQEQKFRNDHKNTNYSLPTYRLLLLCHMAFDEVLLVQLIHQHQEPLLLQIDLVFLALY